MRWALLLLVVPGLAGCLAGDEPCGPTGIAIQDRRAPPGQAIWDDPPVSQRLPLNVTAGRDVLHLRALGCDAGLDYRWTLIQGNGEVYARADGRVVEVPINRAGDFRVRVVVLDAGRPVEASGDGDEPIVQAIHLGAWTAPASLVDESLVLPVTCCPSSIKFGFAGLAGVGPAGNSLGLDNFEVLDETGSRLASDPRWINLRWDDEHGPVPAWALGSSWGSLTLKVLRHDGLGPTANQEVPAVFEVQYDNDSEDRWAALQG